MTIETPVAHKPQVFRKSSVVKDLVDSLVFIYFSSHPVLSAKQIYATKGKGFYLADSDAHKYQRACILRRLCLDSFFKSTSVIFNFNCENRSEVIPVQVTGVSITILIITIA